MESLFKGRKQETGNNTSKQLKRLILLALCNFISIVGVYFKFLKKRNGNFLMFNKTVGTIGFSSL